jgi:hypothetical protein
MKRMAEMSSMSLEELPNLKFEIPFDAKAVITSGGARCAGRQRPDRLAFRKRSRIIFSNSVSRLPKFSLTISLPARTRAARSSTRVCQEPALRQIGVDEIHLRKKQKFLPYRDGYYHGC